MKYIYLPLAFLLLTFSSCKKDEKEKFDITGYWEMTNYIQNGVNVLVVQAYLMQTFLQTEQLNNSRNRQFRI